MKRFLLLIIFVLLVLGAAMFLGSKGALVMHDPEHLEGDATDERITFLKHPFHLVDASYMDARMDNCSVTFSADSRILEMTAVLLQTNKLIPTDASVITDITPFEDALSAYCTEQGIIWESKVTLPLLCRLFETADTSIKKVGDCVAWSIDDWSWIIWPNNNSFIGKTDEYNNLLYGVYFFCDQEIIYWGFFSDNLRNGLGYSFYPNRDCYLGLWHNDKMEGMGIYFFGGQSTSEMYRGDWKNGKMHGQGTYYTSDGQILTGEWIENQLIIQ